MRLCVGTEDMEDIIDALDQALTRAVEKHSIPEVPTELPHRPPSREA